MKQRAKKEPVKNVCFGKPKSKEKHHLSYMTGSFLQFQLLMLPDKIHFIDDRKRGMLTFAMIILVKIYTSSYYLPCYFSKTC